MAPPPEPVDPAKLEAAVKAQKDKNALTEEQIKLLKERGIYLQKESKYYKNQLANIQRYIEALKERNTGERDLNEIIAQQNRMQEAQVNILTSQIREANEFINNSHKERADLLAAEEVAGAKLNALLHEQRGIEEGLLDTTTEREEKVKELIKLEILNKINAIDALKTLKDKVVEQKKLVKEKHKERELEKDVGDATKGMQASTKNFLKTFTGITDQSDSFLGNIGRYTQAKEELTNMHIEAGEFGKALEVIQSKDAFGMIADQAKAVITPLNVAGMVLDKIIESTVAFLKKYDKLTGDFRKNTGIISKGFQGTEASIQNTQRAQLRYGVSIEESFAAHTELNNVMLEFNQLSDDQQARLRGVTTLMGEFGVSAQTTASIFNKFSKGLGYDEKRLEKLGLKIMSIADTLKIPPQVVAEDFNRASSELMKYGDDMIHVFEGLEEQVKQTGLAMDDLLGIAKNFDTFEDAGNHVGRLNAVLGGPYLNAIEMVYATEEERIQLMRDAMKLAPVQFKDMGRHEKQAIALAAGINDMSQAEMLFGATDAQYAQKSMDIQRMQKRAEEAQSVQDKFNQVMTAAAIALGPAVEAFAEFADVLIFLLNPIGIIAEIFGAPDAIVAGIGAITVSVYAMTAAFMKLGASLGASLALAGAIVVAFVLVKMAFEKLGKVWGSIIGIGLTLLALWIAITAATPPPPAGLFAVAMAVGAATAAMATIAGAVGAFDVPNSYALGTPIGGAAGGPALVGEQGAEVVSTTGAQNFLVESPSIVDLGKGDQVITNRNTKAGFAELGKGKGASSSIPPELITSLQRLQTSIDTLNQNIVAENQSPAATEEKQVIIEMDGKKVADTVISRINKKSRLSISKA